MKLTVEKKAKNPGSHENVWYIFDESRNCLGWVRKFDDTRTDTGPFQVFDARNKSTNSHVVCSFWRSDVDLKGMNPDKHQHGKFSDARRFALSYLAEPVTV